MNNSQKFLDYYNRIDALLQEKGGYKKYESFIWKVKNSKNAIIKRYKDDLISFGELRNAIVHSPNINSEPIAEPHKKIVERFGGIYEKISSPLKVIPKFQFQVTGAYFNDYINEILLEMRRNSFSQFPVYSKDRKVIEIITTNTISRWLSKQLESEGTILVEGITVADLILEIEYQKNFKFISRELSVYDVYDLFMDSIKENGRNLDAVFITQSGKSEEKLLGLITVSDLTEFL